MHIPPDIRVFAPPKPPSRPLPAIIGDTLRTARLRVGLNQSEVAKVISISRNAYSRLERGLMLPSIVTLYRLCTALNATPNELLGFHTAMPPDVAAAAKDALRRRVHKLSAHQALALIQLLSGVR
ncbi:helix-turn-helix transcriptional regulator [Myxococcus llanfairpwllgwyngyllgogerychwyrndrobwllllantysiliogogogochensis]|uniref:Helix-turn-helix transcriptional regulator n=1 Tax=Myxococcus llanfairpwllgwyngyllgogerychwyrndrobwllllantysiliogogogochensis TaxID=2590453 RepID=A0A540WNY7_9BACT|nr:helix-turn-helix transcriptional regulator [Myxococcus llanfairpwllgwyngyllgogerychwyrndrobwllllantysiliogogogochensis]TQF10742.1 helix-turn-helix transcriptional regulator [Myxococcus llanfairpwllgwyngyllgogerychwyrndrobwllllantysiliogogogochensis]